MFGMLFFKHFIFFSKIVKIFFQNYYFSKKLKNLPRGTNSTPRADTPRAGVQGRLAPRSTSHYSINCLANCCLGQQQYQEWHGEGCQQWYWQWHERQWAGRMFACPRGQFPSWRLRGASGVELTDWVVEGIAACAPIVLIRVPPGCRPWKRTHQARKQRPSLDQV